MSTFLYPVLCSILLFSNPGALHTEVPALKNNQPHAADSSMSADPDGENLLLASNRRSFHIRTIVIDAGHGGYDPGASGSKTKEKNVTLAIARMLYAEIRKKYPSIRLIMTRDRDEFVELDRRAQIAIQNKANLFISIHCNASAENAVRGTETYAIGLNSTKSNLEVAERENSVILMEDDYKARYQGFDPRRPESYIVFSMVQSHVIARSLKLAKNIQSSLGSMNSRGVKQAGFLVLRKTTMPSVLIETGFITNPGEEEVLASMEGQRMIAGKIFAGFQKYKNAVE